jgi:hypothetical protein
LRSNGDDKSAKQKTPIQEKLANLEGTGANLDKKDKTSKNKTKPSGGHCKLSPQQGSSDQSEENKMGQPS